MGSKNSRGAAEVAELIDRIGRLIRAESHSHDLNPAQWEALRYLTRCNRFSNTPGALARYLRATKGTVSQSLNALERKGLIEKRPDAASGRIVRLALTAAGRRMAQRNDPLQRLADAASALPAALAAQIADGLAAILAGLQASNGYRPFGACRECRHFRGDAPQGSPHWCDLLHERLTEAESRAICAEQEPKAA
jgi:DNA-binding MarR family transcriptional regulator